MNDHAWRARVEALSERNRASPDTAIATELLALRLEAGRTLCARAAVVPPPSAGCIRADWQQGALPMVSRSELDAATLAEALLCHGALFVRGLYDATQVDRFRSLSETGADLAAVPPTGCSATVLFELLEAYRECGLLAAIGPYLANQAVLFAERAKLRHLVAERDRFASIPWHQDASFFGRKAYGVNCWESITPCGKDNPGLGVIPRRLEEIVGWDGEGTAPLDYGKRLPPDLLGELERGHPVVYPEFRPGDALLFDEMTMHTTAMRPWRRPDQLVTISWFFRASAFPGWGTPLAV